MNNKVYIVGYGDVGKAIAECAAEAGYNVKIHDPDKGYIIFEDEGIPLVIHICFPYSKSFVSQVSVILDICKPRLTIIESTVPPQVFDTLFELDYAIVHSPVRGSHPDLFEDLHKMPKFVSGEHRDLCEEYYSKWKIPYEIGGNAKELAAGKILSVNWYGMEIAFAQMIKRYCENNGLDFWSVYTAFQMSMDVGCVYLYDDIKERAYAEEMIPRPVMYASKIKGHCVMQDIALAKENGIGNKKLWDFIEEENDKI